MRSFRWTNCNIRSSKAFISSETMWAVLRRWHSQCPPPPFLPHPTPPMWPFRPSPTVDVHIITNLCIGDTVMASDSLKAAYDRAVNAQAPTFEDMREDNGQVDVELNIKVRGTPIQLRFDCVLCSKSMTITDILHIRGSVPHWILFLHPNTFHTSFWWHNYFVAFTISHLKLTCICVFWVHRNHHNSIRCISFHVNVIWKWCYIHGMNTCFIVWHLLHFIWTIAK